MARAYSLSKLLLRESERGPMLDDESGQILELSKPALLGSVCGTVTCPPSTSVAHRSLAILISARGTDPLSLRRM